MPPNTQNMFVYSSGIEFHFFTRHPSLLRSRWDVLGCPKAYFSTGASGSLPHCDQPRTYTLTFG